VLNFRFALEGPVADPALGLDYSLVVTASRASSCTVRCRAGDVLTSVAAVDDIKDAGRNELITTVTEVTAADGEKVATLRGTIVSRGTAASSSSGQEA
jgi:hypothetical protein